jgi:hypothetical protein
MKTLSIVSGAIFSVLVVLSTSVLLYGRTQSQAAPVHLQTLLNQDQPETRTARSGTSTGLRYATLADPIPVSRVIEHYGSPCRVTIFKDMDRVVLAYPQFAVQLLPIDDHISLDSPVDYVTLVDPAYANSWNLCNPGRDLGPTYIQRKWHGFATLSLYKTFSQDFSYQQ